MDKDEAPSDNNGNANGDEGIQQIYDNKFEEAEQDCKNESEICGESNKNDQEERMNDDKNNSKAKEGDIADSKDNGNSDPNTDKETEQQSEREGGSTNPIKAVDVTENKIDEDSKSTETQTGQDNMTNADQDKSKAIEGAETEDNSNGSSTTDRDNENQSKNQKGSTNPINKAEGTTKNDAHTKEDGERQSSETETRRGSTNPINEAEGTTNNDAHTKVDGDMQSTETCPSTDYDMCEDVDIACLKRDLASVIEERNAYKLVIEELYDLVKHKSDDTAVSTNKESTKPDPLQITSTNVPAVIKQLKRRFQELEEAVSVHKREVDQERKHNESLKTMHKDLEEFVTTKCDQRNLIFKFVSRKPVTNVDNVVSHISEYYQQLQGELDKHNQEVQRLKSSLDYNTTQQKSKIADLKREIDNLKKDLQANTCQYEMTKKKLDDQEKANLEIAEKQVGLQKKNSAQKDEIDAVKSELNQAHQYITIYDGNQKQNESIINQLNGTINEQSNQIQQQTSHIRRQDQNIERLEKHLATLEEKHTKLTLRLSKLAGAHLTRNNPNITDLSDVNRPTKLAEKYSELYDNEWTDAYEECTDAWKMDEETCVATMLDLLRKADAECLKLLQPHRDILKTLTTVTVTLEKPVVTVDESTQTELIHVDAEVQTEQFARIDELVQTNTTLNLKELKENEEPMDTNENNTREESSLEMTEVSGRSQCQQCDSSCSTGTPVVQATQVGDQHPEGPAASNVTENQDGTKEQPKEEEQTVQDQMAQVVTDQQFKTSVDTEEVTHAKDQTLNMTENQDRSEMQPNGKEEQLDSSNSSSQDKPAVNIANQPFESNVDTGEKTAEININAEFTEEQKKAVSDMRKLCGTKLEQEGSISKVIAQKIAIEEGIDINSSDKVMTFITKCAQLCWYMAIQEPPVVIGFREPAANENFDKDVYKAYTKVGKKVDFVVWPPVYLYKEGPMLCKGTAQGKD